MVCCGYTNIFLFKFIQVVDSLIALLASLLTMTIFFFTAIPDGFRIDPQPSQEPIEGQNLSLSCHADNYTYENLQWYRLNLLTLHDAEGNPLVLECRNVHQYAARMKGEMRQQSGTNTAALVLNIPNISLEDEGDYVCEVQNRKTREKHCQKKYISVLREYQNLA